MSSTLDFVYGVTELTSVLIGILLNPLTLPYFYQNKEHVSSLLYFLIVITDILTLVSTFPSALSMMNQNREMLLSNKALCTVSGFVFNISARLSVFQIAILALARALTLLFPFRTVHVKKYIYPLLAYFLINVVLASLPLFFSSQGYHYEGFLGQCAWGISELSFVEGNTWVWRFITYTTIILPWLVPGVVVVVSCVVSILVLVRSDRNHKKMTTRRPATKLKKSEAEGAASRTRHVSITMIIMTAVYILFNMPCWLFYLYLFACKLNPQAWVRAKSARYIHIFVSRLSVSLNAAVNPIVYFSRIEGLRRLGGRADHTTGSVGVSRNVNNVRLFPVYNRPGAAQDTTSRTPIGGRSSSAQDTSSRTPIGGRSSSAQFRSAEPLQHTHPTQTCSEI